MTASGRVIEGRALIAGSAAGPTLALDEPLSFWGGLDPERGVITDTRHPQCGAEVRGTVLVMPFGRGSSSATSVLAEAIRLGNAPVAIVMREPDEIVVLGALVAADLYGTVCPVVVVSAADYAIVAASVRVEIAADGRVEVAAHESVDRSAHQRPEPDVRP